MNHTSVRMVLCTQFPVTCPESSRRGMKIDTAVCPGDQQGSGRSLALTRLLCLVRVLLSLVLWKSILRTPSAPVPLLPSVPPSLSPLASPSRHLLLFRRPQPPQSGSPFRSTLHHRDAGFLPLKGGLPCRSVSFSEMPPVTSHGFQEKMQTPLQASSYFSSSLSSPPTEPFAGPQIRLTGRPMLNRTENNDNVPFQMVRLLGLPKMPHPPSGCSCKVAATPSMWGLQGD